MSKIEHGLQSALVAERQKRQDAEKKLTELQEQITQLNDYQSSQIAKNINDYPALLIDLPSQLTNHQIEAVKIASHALKWHPRYVSEFCCTVRPRLFHRMEDVHWQANAEAWQKEHEMSVADLAQSYVDYFEGKCAYRVYEPVEWFDEVRIMAVDMSESNLPCPVKEWNPFYPSGNTFYLI